MPSTLITLTTSNPVPKIAFLYSSSDKFDLSAKVDTATPSGQETLTVASGQAFCNASVTCDYLYSMSGYNRK